MPEVFSLCSGETVSGEFLADDALLSGEFARFALFGYPGASVGSPFELWKIYSACESLSAPLEITVNGEVVFQDSVF
jgi:hypothetical protein